MNARTQVYAAEAAEIEASTQRALAARQEGSGRRMTAMEAMSVRLGVNEEELTAALTKTVFKECRSKAEFLALIVVANEYRLNPLTKEIYAFPAKGGGVVPMVSVDGWITLMNSHPEFDGIEFDYHDDEGSTVAVEAVIYRKDRSRPIKVIEYMDECKGPTGPWKSHPRRMLRHRALIQCARVAFGFSGIYAQGDDVNGLIEGEFSTVADRPVLPRAGEFNAEPQDDDQGGRENPGEEARPSYPTDPQTGMSAVDEETARRLDAGEAFNPDDEQVDQDGVVQPEEQPLWLVAANGVKQMIASASTKRAWQAADTEFQKIAAGLPEDIAQQIDQLLVAKRNEISAAAAGQG